MKKAIKDLTDQEIEDCINGSSNIKMIRDILTKPNVVDNEGWVDPEIFADWFAHGVEGYIDAKQDTDEWIEANDNNWTWGYDIGDNINSLISDNFKDNENAA